MARPRATCSRAFGEPDRVHLTIDRIRFALSREEFCRLAADVARVLDALAQEERRDPDV